MCLIGINIGRDGDLLIAANRDEFSDRPTLPMHWWNEGLLAGKDLKAGGTWLGITRNGRFAAVTNVRDPAIKSNPVPRSSRGRLVSEFLLSNVAPKAYVDDLCDQLDTPSPFNLIVGTIATNRVDAWWLGGRVKTVAPLLPGSHTLSNAELNTPWPKSQRLIAMLNAGDVDAIMSAMGEREEAPDHALPTTGVPHDWEKKLSAIHITGHDYHTRSTSLILVRHQTVTTKEFTWHPDGRLANEVHHEFQMDTTGV